MDINKLKNEVLDIYIDKGILSPAVNHVRRETYLGLEGAYNFVKNTIKETEPDGEKGR